MGKVGKDKIIVGANCPKWLVEKIDERAEQLGWTRSQYALEILKKWDSEGCPPVSQADQAMQLLNESKAPQKV